MNGGRYLDASLLTPGGIAQLHSPAAAMNMQGDAYGMGWVVSPSRGSQGEPSIWHSGDTANFHSDMIILPRKQLGIIVLTNVNGELARMTNAQGMIAQGVQSLLLGQQPPSRSTFGQRYLFFNATLFLCSMLVLPGLFYFPPSIRLHESPHQSPYVGMTPHHMSLYHQVEDKRQGNQTGFIPKGGNTGGSAWAKQTQQGRIFTGLVFMRFASRDI